MPILLGPHASPPAGTEISPPDLGVRQGRVQLRSRTSRAMWRYRVALTEKASAISEKPRKSV